MRCCFLSPVFPRRFLPLTNSPGPETHLPPLPHSAKTGREDASRKTLLRQKDKVNNDLQNDTFRERWAYIAEPGWEVNQEIFTRVGHRRTKVLNCAIPLTQAKRLTDAVFPPGWDADKCLVASVGRKARPELENWEYTPQIRAAPEWQLVKAQAICEVWSQLPCWPSNGFGVGFRGTCGDGTSGEDRPWVCV